MSSTKNFNGQNVVKHIDTYHGGKLRTYCGSFVGQSGYMNPCGRCTGNCGPNNGCQCKACYDLDMEVRKRSILLGLTNEESQLLNEAGARCYVSYDPSSRHNNRSGQYKFYCGRNVGSAGYHNHCTSCDGRCGPDDGCQCRSCYALEKRIEILKLPSTNNRDYRSRFKFDNIHTHSLRHYCGVGQTIREMHNPCGNCGLTCGPEQGCQCKGCYELDTEYDVRAEILGIDKFHMYNTEEVMVSISYCHANRHDPTSGQYRFYCHRHVGQVGYHNHCTSCDGQCGPTNGCQCHSCYELEQIYRGTSSLPSTLPSPLPVATRPPILPPSTPQPATITTTTTTPSSSGRMPSPAVFTTAVVPTGKRNSKEDIADEIASYTTIEQCNEMQNQLDQWRVLLASKRKSIEENKKEDDSKICVVCQENAKCMALIPCGHVCLCADCSPIIMSHNKRCPLCTKGITSTIKVYI